METIHEQMEYGSHCVHGKNLGTPGGADLMCGACELGLSVWVEVPTFQLFYGIGQATTPIYTWTGHPKAVDKSHVYRIAKALADNLDPEIMADFQFEVREIASGYWTDEDYGSEWDSE